MTVKRMDNVGVVVAEGILIRLAQELGPQAS